MKYTRAEKLLVGKGTLSYELCYVCMFSCIMYSGLCVSGGLFEGFTCYLLDLNIDVLIGLDLIG